MALKCVIGGLLQRRWETNTPFQASFVHHSLTCIFLFVCLYVWVYVVCVCKGTCTGRPEEDAECPAVPLSLHPLEKLSECGAWLATSKLQQFSCLDSVQYWACRCMPLLHKILHECLGFELMSASLYDECSYHWETSLGLYSQFVIIYFFTWWHSSYITHPPCTYIYECRGQRLMLGVFWN